MRLGHIENKKKKDENLGGSGWLTANKLTVVRRLDFAFVFPTLGLCCGSGTKLEPRGRGVTTIQIERVEKKKKKLMASICLSIPSFKTLAILSPSYTSSTSSPSSSSSSSSSSSVGDACFVRYRCSIPMFDSQRVVSTHRLRAKRQVVRMAPDEEKLTRRNPLDFPIVCLSLFPLFV